MCVVFYFSLWTPCRITPDYFHHEAKQHNPIVDGYISAWFCLLADQCQPFLSSWMNNVFMVGLSYDKTRTTIRSKIEYSALADTIKRLSRYHSAAHFWYGRHLFSLFIGLNDEAGAWCLRHSAVRKHSGLWDKYHREPLLCLVIFSGNARHRLHIAQWTHDGNKLRYISFSAIIWITGVTCLATSCNTILS